MMPTPRKTMMKGALAFALLSLPGAALADTWIVSAKDGSAVMKVTSCRVTQGPSGFIWEAEVGGTFSTLGSGYKCDGDNITGGINDQGAGDLDVRDAGSSIRRTADPRIIQPLRPSPPRAPAPAPTPAPKPPRP